MAQVSNLNMGVLIGYALELIDTHNMLEPDWLDEAIAQGVKEVLKDAPQKADIKHSQDMQKIGTRTVLGLRSWAIKEIAQQLEGQDKTDYLLKLIGGDPTDPHFIDDMTNYQAYNINGSRRMLKNGPDAKPEIPGVHPSNIVACETGYHIKGRKCDGCNQWRECPIRKEEYLEYLMRTDPNMRQEKTRRYVENYQRDVDKKDYR
jgi:hypothetical protein